MTSSAGEWARDSDLLERALWVYRDLSVALAEKITKLKAGIGVKADCDDTTEALVACRKALQTVIDQEAKVGRRNKEWAGGTGALDLDAARAEIVARLSIWAAAR